MWSSLIDNVILIVDTKVSGDAGAWVGIVAVTGSLLDQPGQGKTIVKHRVQPGHQNEDIRLTIRRLRVFPLETRRLKLLVPGMKTRGRSNASSSLIFHPVLPCRAKQRSNSFCIQFWVVKILRVKQLRGTRLVVDKPDPVLSYRLSVSCFALAVASPFYPYFPPQSNGPFCLLSR